MTENKAGTVEQQSELSRVIGSGPKRHDCEGINYIKFFQIAFIKIEKLHFLSNVGVLVVYDEICNIYHGRLDITNIYGRIHSSSVENESKSTDLDLDSP